MTDRKRILFLVGGTSVFGAEIAMLNLMRCLRKKGYEIHCIVSGWGDGDFPSRLDKERIPYSRIKLGFVYFRKFLWSVDTLCHYPLAVRDFLKIKKEFDPHYVYHSSFRTVIMAYPFLSKENTLLHVHDKMIPSLKNRVFCRILKSKVFGFIGVSESVKQNLITLGIPRRQITVVLNGTRDFTLKFSRRQRNCQEKFTIGIVGRIAPMKGHVVLLDALRLVRRLGDDFECSIIGRGERGFVRRLENLISDYGLTGSVRWSGYVTDPNEIYGGLDVLIVPSYQEAFGLTALEGSMCGLPVIASRVGGLPEIVDDGRTGFLFPVGNHRELAEKIRELKNNKELRRKMGKAARSRALAEFSLEAMTSKVDEILSRLSNGDSRIA
jgi:glycosyltransferase involved in cell wall biosynthesis